MAKENLLTVPGDAKVNFSPVPGRQFGQVSLGRGRGGFLPSTNDLRSFKEAMVKLQLTAKQHTTSPLFGMK